MRKLLLASAAVLGLATAAAQAQNSVTNTLSPPAPNAGSQMPEPTNSLPSGAGATTRVTPGSNLGTTQTAPAPVARPRPMAAQPRPYNGRAMRPRPAAAPPVDPAAADQSAPPTEAYTGGTRSPYSQNAANITAGDTRSEMAPRLPDPAAGGNSPRDFLTAAQRALASNRTGAAQEALERAETRLLSRSTDPSMADRPDDRAMVQSIGDARRALANRNVAGARAAINAALSGG